jgi:hypothetical protein
VAFYLRYDPRSKLAATKKQGHLSGDLFQLVMMWWIQPTTKQKARKAAISPSLFRLFDAT